MGLRCVKNSKDLELNKLILEEGVGGAKFRQKIASHKQLC